MCNKIKYEDSNAHHNRGNVLKILDRKEEALESYDRAIELNPKGAGAYYNRGVLLSELDRKEEAFESYDKAIELNPNYVVAYNNQGMILYDLNRKKEALKHFDKAIDINPEFIDALYNRGILLERLNRKEEALASYEKIIELDPRSVPTYNKMALLLFQESRLEEAIEVFQNVIKHSVEDSILAEINISFIKILQNKLEEAKDILDKAWLKTNQKEPFTAKNLGHYFILKKEESLAVSYYQKCLKLPPKDEDMYQHLQDDYNLLKLEEKGITPEDYQKIIMELKNEH